MIQAPKLSRRARWAIPAGALVVTGGVLAGSLISVAQAAPGLPARTAAQLLTEVADSTPPPLTGTVVETASFGLPALPATGNPTSLSSLLTGSHTVRVDSNVTVAGQAAYALVLAPKDARSLVGQVQIDVDGSNGVPLRLQVFARGASSPAFQVGYTDIAFVKPAAADLSFTPPPGATVSQVNLSDSHPGASMNHATPDVTTIGSGWLTVLKLPSSTLTQGAPGSGGPSAGDSTAVLRTLLAAAKPVHGSWGSGRLLQTSLVSVLLTDQGPAFIGAVQPSVLYAAAAQH